MGLLALAPLEEGPGHVDEQRCLPFGDGDRAQVDPAGQVDGGPGVAECDGHVDLVHLRVDRAEGGAAQVRVRAERRAVSAASASISCAVARSSYWAAARAPRSSTEPYTDSDSGVVVPVSRSRRTAWFCAVVTAAVR